MTNVRAGDRAISPAGWLLSSIGIVTSQVDELVPELYGPVLIDVGRRPNDVPRLLTIPYGTFFRLNPEVLQGYAVQHPRGALLDSGARAAWIVKHVDVPNGTMAIEHEGSTDAVETADVIRHNLDALSQRTKVRTAANDSHAIFTSAGVSAVSGGDLAHRSTESLQEEFDMLSASIGAQLYFRQLGRGVIDIEEVPELLSEFADALGYEAIVTCGEHQGVLLVALRSTVNSTHISVSLSPDPDGKGIRVESEALAPGARRFRRDTRASRGDDQYADDEVKDMSVAAASVSEALAEAERRYEALVTSSSHVDDRRGGGRGDMLGWWIGVFRQPHGGHAPASFDTVKGIRLAVWQTGLGGLDWLDELAKDGRAIALGGDGYPIRFTAQCEQLLPRIENGPPNARAVWLSDPTDIIDYDKWPGRTTIDREAIADCSPDEWLLVEARDES
jgi:hypothetical protein